MENIRAKMNDAGKLVLFINPNVKGEETQTGKSIKLAWTQRFEKLEVEGMPEGEYSLMFMLLRNKKKGAKKKVEAADEDDGNDDDEMVETKTKNKGRKPKLNLDKNGKVKPIATSKRPVDKLKARRAK